MPNDPYLDSSVRWKIKSGQTRNSEPRYREMARSLLDAGMATEVLRKIGSGKEADVYLCRDGAQLIAVKVYRTYRTSHAVSRDMKLDAIGHLAAWEYDLLVYAYRDGAPVPRPIRREEHTFSMQYLGTVEAPAPQLKDVRDDNLAALADRTFRAVERLAESGVVHTDLSPYNILVDQGEPWIIDVGSCLRVDRLGQPPWLTAWKAREALDAGARHLSRFFSAHGVEIDVAEFVGRLMKGIDRYGVLDG
jgi:RIO kinase 1